MKKVYPDAKTALDGILKDGMMIMSGGFGLCGIAEVLSDAIRAGWITPVPGGIGPMTIAMLLSNTLDAATARN